MTCVIPALWRCVQWALLTRTEIQRLRAKEDDLVREKIQASKGERFVRGIDPSDAEEAAKRAARAAKFGVAVPVRHHDCFARVGWLVGWLVGPCVPCFGVVSVACRLQFHAAALACCLNCCASDCCRGNHHHRRPQKRRRAKQTFQRRSVSPC